MRQQQMSRQKQNKMNCAAGGAIFANAQMSQKQIKEFCPLSDESRELLHKAVEELGFSARAYDKILKVSRTIADLEGSADILPAHIAEAIQYRCLDRREWVLSSQTLENSRGIIKEFFWRDIFVNPHD